MDKLEKGIAVNLQPLVDKLAELADLGTLLLLFMIIVLLGLLVSERSRNHSMTESYLKQSVEVVKVLTSLKNLFDSNMHIMQSNDKALSAISNKLFEIQHVVGKRRGDKYPIERRASIDDADSEVSDEMAP